MDDSPPSIEDRIVAFWNTLPALSKHDLDPDDSCPICFTSFDALLGNCGITKLRCGHTFCRKDLAEWIRNLHGNCPTCRYDFLDIHPPGSDDESSDGGEYIPNEDDEDEEDSYLFTSDGFTDAEDADMDLEEDDLWERSDADDIDTRASSEEFSSEGDSKAEVQFALTYQLSWPAIRAPWTVRLTKSTQCKSTS
ncbi:hypothetical protein GGX14DRAFT_414472, partial [Mycena pura]